MQRRNFLGLLLMGSAGACLGGSPAFAGYPVTHSDMTWRTMLSPEAFHVLREEGTEKPFSSPLDMNYRKGTYLCRGCDRALFSSKTKYNSHTGWPSFWKPLPNAIGTKRDLSYGMERTEVHCSGCGGHLGHVFLDGPKPTGLRYCMNGVALKFKPA